MTEGLEARRLDLRVGVTVWIPRVAALDVAAIQTGSAVSSGLMQHVNPGSRFPPNCDIHLLEFT